MEFPKMLYRTAESIADQEALKAALVSGTVQTLIVESAADQAKAKGWTEDLASLIKSAESK